MLLETRQIQGVKTNAFMDLVSRYVGISRRDAAFVTTESESGLEEYADNSLTQLVHVMRCNNTGDLNSFFSSANKKLKVGGVFVCRTETLVQRKNRHKAKYGKLQPFHYPLDFLLKRIFPKMSLTRGIYFALTKGKNRAMSKTEVLGRLVYSGFEIIEIEEIDGLLCIVAKKKGRPLDAPEPSHGMLLKIPRIGAEGKAITVYKFRTMHPYAQYVQAYVHQNNALAEGGKFKNDFRITKWGRWMRRFWIDEIPMLWNILKGDLKLVGVRPISSHYMSLYTAEHQTKRMGTKPGFIPPFYADMPVTLTDIMESESRYIDNYNEEGWRADLDYVVKAVNNVLVHKARSN